MAPEPDLLPKGAPPKEASPSGAATAVLTETRGGQGGRRLRVDLTTGSIPKKLFGQAWPQVIEGVLNIADQGVDLFWAGRLPSGFRAIASIGVAQTFTQFAQQSRGGFDTSMRAMIARAVGARNLPLANHVLFQGLLLTAAYSLLMVLIGIFLTDFFLGLIKASDALREQTGLYMRIQFIGAATQAFRQSTGTALQAAGEPMAPMRSTLVSRIIHIILTPFLIFGWAGLPEMGLAGAALSTVLAQGIGIGMNVYALSNGSSRLRLTFKGSRADFPMIGRIVKIGMPASVRGTERAVSKLVFLGLVAPFGDVALSAYALTGRLEQFSNFANSGVSNASGVMVGQNLGAEQPARAKQAVWWSLAYVAVMNVFIRGLFWLFPVWAVLLFTQDASVVDLTVHWVRIQLIGSFFMGLMIVYQESFNGAGDTVAPLVVTLLGVWAIEVPLAWFLCTQTSLGPLGIAYAAVAGFSSRAFFFFVYFFQGRWLRIKVI